MTFQECAILVCLCISESSSLFMWWNGSEHKDGWQILVQDHAICFIVS